MSKSPILSLMLEPGQPPRPIYLQASIAAFNKAVSIGAVHIGQAKAEKLNHNIYIIYNRYSYLEGLDGNRRINGKILSGVLYITATDDSKAPRSFSTSELQKYSYMFATPDTFTEDEIINYHVDALLASIQ